MGVQREDLRRAQKKLLDAVVAAGAGAALAVGGNRNHSLQILGTFVATIALERSNVEEPASTDWVSIGTATAPGFIDAVDKPALWIRANVTAFTSGTINAWGVSTP